LISAQPGARIARGFHDLEALGARRDGAMRRLLEARRSELGRIGAQIAALSPLAVLDRGYAMVSREGDHGREILRDSAHVTEGEQLAVRLARGELNVVVKGKHS